MHPFIGEKILEADFNSFAVSVVSLSRSLYGLKDVFEVFHAGFPLSVSSNKSELGFLAVVHRGTKMTRKITADLIQRFSLFTRLGFIEGFDYTLQAIQVPEGRTR